MGHQVQWAADLKRRPRDAKSLTKYGTTNDKEYFAEHFVAWVIDADSYRAFDPIGADYIEAEVNLASKAGRRFL